MKIIIHSHDLISAGHAGHKIGSPTRKEAYPKKYEKMQKPKKKSAHKD